ncbi:MAG: tetratricopeptide repeat protein [Pseudomonadota bacterium]
MTLRFKKIVLASAIGLFGHFSSAIAGDLQSVETVIARLEKGALPTQLGSSESAQLLLDIVAFRTNAVTLSPDLAATGWLTLWDRTRKLGPVNPGADIAAFDADIGKAVGLRSVLAALPAPAAWPLLRQQAEARAAQTPDEAGALGLQMITRLLTGDSAAVTQSLSQFERIAAAGDPQTREYTLAGIDYTRAEVFKLYGSRDQIAESFRVQLNAQSRQAYGTLRVPDLVGLLGAEKAEVLLQEALRKPVVLHIAEGEDTRALTRKLALADMAGLRKPQWQLIDRLGTAALYEAMLNRFEPNAAEAKAVEADDASDAEAEAAGNYPRKTADAYYFLDLVLAGRQKDAELAMIRATSGGTELHFTKQTMAALVKSGQNQAVYDFLSQFLAHRPQSQAWDVYLEQAAKLGHAGDAISLLDSILSRSDISPHLRLALQNKRLDALLGDDQVDEATAGMRAVLATAPTREDENVSERGERAIRLAGLGRVLGQPVLSGIGLDFARQVLQLKAVPNAEYWRVGLLQKLWAELRRHNRSDEAQELALTEAEAVRTDGPASSGYGAFYPAQSQQLGLIELAGIYDAAGRHDDVLRLLNEIDGWGLRDILPLIAVQDSLGTPLGLMAARALQASGNLAAAKLSVRAVLDKMPGYDPAYQLFIELHGDHASEELDRLYLLDQFEERPLIWKAVALAAAGHVADAESVVRRAIAIDPSDGEQGPKDRMRAYATLADALDAKGDAEGAKQYRRPVAAIRMSEQADEYRLLGLHKRATDKYRAALDEFSDAYCIQSRLAIELGKAGLHERALTHYRRAYELMPDSFGRVESHCFGCESVFVDATAQGVAEQVFTDLIARGPTKPQAHYMLGYLRKEQGRFDEAVALFRQAVALDAQYLNAWKHLHALGELTYIEPAERDIARLKLLELDPQQRHVKYKLNEVTDFVVLWNALERAAQKDSRNPSFEQVYPLERSALLQDDVLAKMPPEMRAQMQKRLDLGAAMQRRASAMGARRSALLGQHSLIEAALGLMGDRNARSYD